MIARIGMSGLFRCLSKVTCRLPVELIQDVEISVKEHIQAQVDGLCLVARVCTLLRLMIPSPVLRQETLFITRSRAQLIFHGVKRRGRKALE